MRKGLFIIGILALAAFISACTIKAARIELSTSSFDLGGINPDDGIRTETFYIKNTGNALLNISYVSTSCGCTDAEVRSSEVYPGEQTELIVKYDPSVHPDFVGKIKRVVYIKSNDPLNEEVELELIGNSLPSSGKRADNKSKEGYEGLEGQ